MRRSVRQVVKLCTFEVLALRVSAGHVGGTRGSGIVSSVADVIGMRGETS